MTGVMALPWQSLVKDAIRIGQQPVQNTSQGRQAVSPGSESVGEVGNDTSTLPPEASVKFANPSNAPAGLVASGLFPPYVMTSFGRYQPKALGPRHPGVNNELLMVFVPPKSKSATLATPKNHSAGSNSL